MRSRRIVTTPTQIKVGVMTGGIKENKSQVELGMCDLLRGHNYNEVDGEYKGYRSLPGYEAFDGTQAPSEVAVVVTESEGVVTYNDTSREARRAAITKVGGAAGFGSVTGCFETNGVVYATRNNSSDTLGKMWKSTSSGWSEIPNSQVVSYTSGTKNTGTMIDVGDSITGSGITGTVLHIYKESGVWASGTAAGKMVIKVLTGTLTSGTLTGSDGSTAQYTVVAGSMGKGGSYSFSTGRFDLFADLQRKDVVFFASGVGFPSYIKNDTIVPILSPYLPDNEGTGTYATSVIEFKNRLWLGYPDGSLVFSNVGNPADFDPTTFSGVIYLGDEIVDLKISVGNTLVVFCKNSIQVISALSTSSTTTQTVSDYLFSNTTLTSTSGCVNNTPATIFDDLFYIDPRGLTSVSATDKYGDFETKSYSKYIQRTLLTNYDYIVGSYVDEEANQYRLFFSSGLGIIFTFGLSSSKYTSTSSKIVKGITTFRYLTQVSCVGNKIFGSTDGFVYKIDSGTSFNGSEIETELSTSYFNYGAPTLFKRFKEVYFEGFIPYKLDFKIRADFEYRFTEYIQSTVDDELIIAGGESEAYGVGSYDTMRYGSSENQTAVYYVSSFGTNMSLSLRTSSKYSSPHTLSSMIVQYSINGRKM